MGVRKRSARGGQKVNGGRTREASLLEPVPEGAPTTGAVVACLAGRPPRERPSRNLARAAAGLRPDAAEILSAIHSLYDDQLKPVGRILRKRLAERAVAVDARRRDDGKLPDINVNYLRAFCDSNPLVQVFPEEGGDWSVSLGDREDDFVDILTPVDTYSEEFWSNATAYFSHLAQEAMSLPGGRYTCAQMLMQRGVPFLGDFTLGQMCHFIQVAITQRKVLGYADGAVVPYAFSQSKVKDQCAGSQQPCAASGCPSGFGQEFAGPISFGTWSSTVKCLREVFKEAAGPAPGLPAVLPLSNIKSTLRSRFGLELSETMLGYAKLSDLLNDKRFVDICHVECKAEGYVVVQSMEMVKARQFESSSFVTSLLHARRPADFSDSDESDDETASPDRGSPTPRGFSFAGELGLGCDEDDGYEAFTTSLPVATPLLSPGVPAGYYMQRWNVPTPKVGALTSPCPPVSIEGLRSIGETSPLRHGCAASLGTVGGDFSWEGGTPLPSPGVFAGSSRQWASQFPTIIQNLHGSGVRHLPEPPPAKSPIPSPSQPCSPAAMSWNVRNTFVFLPSTPMPGCRQRARSVPKDLDASRTCDGNKFNKGIGSAPARRRRADNYALSDDLLSMQFIGYQGGCEGLLPASLGPKGAMLLESSAEQASPSHFAFGCAPLVLGEDDDDNAEDEPIGDLSSGGSDGTDHLPETPPIRVLVPPTPQSPLYDRRHQLLAAEMRVLRISEHI